MVDTIKRWAVIAVVVASAMTGAANAHAQDATRTVAQALLQFEAEMKWEAVQDSWRGTRPGWVSGLQSARTAQQVASALGVLEVAMKWEAVDDSWRGRRPSWVAAVAAARTPQQVAQLLLDLEQATTWAAMNDSWHGSRPGWVATLQGVVNGGGGGARPQSAFAVGQGVQVLWNGTWYPSVILAANSNGTYRIHYTGWESSWDEDVGTDRMRP